MTNEHNIKAGHQCTCGVMLYPASNAQVDKVAALEQHRREEAAIEDVAS